MLADPVRRRILEILGPGEVSAGGIGSAGGAEFGISQPAVSQHLKVLRETGLAVVRPQATQRLYRVDRVAVAAAGGWFEQFADPFRQPLDALATELARGQRSVAVDRVRRQRRRVSRAAARAGSDADPGAEQAGGVEALVPDREPGPPGAGRRDSAPTCRRRVRR